MCCERWPWVSVRSARDSQQRQALRLAQVPAPRRDELARQALRAASRAARASPARLRVSSRSQRQTSPRVTPQQRVQARLVVGQPVLHHPRLVRQPVRRRARRRLGVQRGRLRFAWPARRPAPRGRAERDQAPSQPHRARSLLLQQDAPSGAARQRTASPAASGCTSPPPGGRAGTARARRDQRAVHLGDLRRRARSASSAWRPSGTSSRGCDQRELASSHGIECATSRRLRVAVVRRARLDDVGDPDVRALEPGLGEQLVEQLARRGPRTGAPARPRVRPGRLAHEHHRRASPAALAGHAARAGLARLEAAPAAVADVARESSSVDISRRGAAGPPSARARGGWRAGACAARPRRAPRRSWSRSPAAARSPCRGSRGRCGAGPRARARSAGRARGRPRRGADAPANASSTKPASRGEKTASPSAIRRTASASSAPEIVLVT